MGPTRQPSASLCGTACAKVGTAMRTTAGGTRFTIATSSFQTQGSPAMNGAHSCPISEDYVWPSLYDLSEQCRLTSSSSVDLRLLTLCRAFQRQTPRSSSWNGVRTREGP